MATDQFAEGFAPRAVDLIISEFNDKLNDRFLSETNHDSKLVTVAKIPDGDKEELTRLVTDQGYEVSYVD
ncbi:hypothetical protein [Mucilaginibacter myungsuensis]|uniref:Uncharacterized protein n=1 Tax=Mucilaginibacter myungsuensis TaxID=649104 RepID=A0A929KZP3_9SPHI|nr:hypothetical protein [Mucilaginibacter myungsuensis]MBE9663418.1 hypothetical protein [Mucilaginibacter myungsuensis]MDN3600154.1 hypothetical protein [Mucilaginibacter myungsuensis]